MTCLADGQIDEQTDGQKAFSSLNLVAKSLNSG